MPLYNDTYKNEKTTVIKSDLTMKDLAEIRVELMRSILRFKMDGFGDSAKANNLRLIVDKVTHADIEEA